MFWGPKGSRLLRRLVASHAYFGNVLSLSSRRPGVACYHPAWPCMRHAILTSPVGPPARTLFVHSHPGRSPWTSSAA